MPRPASLEALMAVSWEITALILGAPLPKLVGHSIANVSKVFGLLACFIKNCQSNTTQLRKKPTFYESSAGYMTQVDYPVLQSVKYMTHYLLF